MRRSLCAICIFLCSLSAIAASISVEIYEERLKFTEALDKDDFGSVERSHKLFTSTGKRSTTGRRYADLHAHFASLLDCYDNTSKVSNGIPTIVKKAWPPEVCRTTQKRRLDSWAARAPGSVLVTIARAHVIADQARSINPRELARAAEREKQFDLALLALDTTPSNLREPLWYLERMQIGIDQGWGSKQYWPLVLEATTRYPNHDEIYRQAARYFHPSKGGSIEDIEQLAQLGISKSLRTDGSSMYAHVYDEVILGVDGLGEMGMFKTHLSWPTMKAGLDDIVQRYPAQYNLELYARYACMAQDIRLLKKLLERIPEETEPSASRPWYKGQLNSCRRMAAKKRF